MTAPASTPVAVSARDAWAPDHGAAVEAGGYPFRAETLPGWTYDNAEFHALERERLFLRSWQFVCHVSEVASPGAFATLNLMGERALVVRGDDGTLRGFYNVCRHRAAAVAEGDNGSCEGQFRCPYHGWTYGLDGSLKAVPGQQS
jgi:phenylpropionate dioxygenase-like ring-hydroxylating dioxygenase large terminal subunit